MRRITFAGIPRDTYKDAIHTALKTYSDRTDGELSFDLKGATLLEPTPRKLNSARSTTNVTLLGEHAGKLTVILFNPGDGTGDGSTFRRENTTTGDYPWQEKILPRRKTDVAAEAHLTIAAFSLGQHDPAAVLFAGNLDMLGMNEEETGVLRRAELGQKRSDFQLFMGGGVGEYAEPTATLTVDPDGPDRFCDPHAVYNPHPEMVQVCAFYVPEAAFVLKGLDFLDAVAPDRLA